MGEPGTIGQYLIDQLYAHGVEHVFGVPGDYVLGFFDQLTVASTVLDDPQTAQGGIDRVIHAALRNKRPV
jgi:TPP-dependent 2-oxoacid decarboxylase